jgi:hypothetical protein
MTENNTDAVPAVIVSLGDVLNSISVEKRGTLPSNMGGKGYATAEDISTEVKTRFVENNLIIVPNEALQANDAIVNGSRTTYSIIIRGEYRVISTIDGSEVVISGVGHGVATGTSVAANIASTNALKDALLRTFLITETAVEEQGKAPTEPKEPAALGRARDAGYVGTLGGGKITRDNGDRPSLNELRTALKEGHGIGTNKKLKEALADNFPDKYDDWQSVPAGDATNINALTALLAKLKETGQAY